MAESRPKHPPALAVPIFQALEPRLLLSGTIEGQVWEDLNGDGFRDPGEDGLNGWTVQLVHRSTQQVAATTETANYDVNADGTIDPLTETGIYLFEGISPGVYDLHRTTPAGWTTTYESNNYEDIQFYTTFGGEEQTFEPFKMDPVWNDSAWSGLSSPPMIWKMNRHQYYNVWPEYRGESWFDPAGLAQYTPGGEAGGRAWMQSSISRFHRARG